MMDFDQKLEMAYKYCKLLKVECIKKELDAQLEGYKFENIEWKNSEWTVHYKDQNKAYIILSISFNKFSIMKNTDHQAERISIDENMLLTDRIIDKRQNGVIYSIVQKQFTPSSRFNQIVLADLIEQRFTITREKIKNLLKSVDFDSIGLTNLLLKLKMLENKVDLKSQSDFYSEFSTHMNYYFNWEGGRKITDNIYPTRTYLNGEEVSSIFVLDGPDKLYRIYDLYNGIISPRNENDINCIHLGLLSQDAFNFKELKGINEHEDVLVGAPLVNEKDTYIDYLREFFDQKYGYKGSIKLDRDSMLLGITYQMSGSEKAKREIEKKLGISYSEFEQLDFDEQKKLIEQKTGKKIQYDYRLHIDGIPMDEDHIITREKIDRQIDTLNSSGPKKILKRLLRPFNKR